MKSTTWIMEHDLSLTFDPQGRLWRFRATAEHGTQPVDASMDGSDLVISVTVPNIQPGEIDIQVRGDVLEIRGTAAGTKALICNVGLPLAPEMHTLETSYRDGAFDVRVPLAPATVTVQAPAVAEPVAV